MGVKDGPISEESVVDELHAVFCLSVQDSLIGVVKFLIVTAAALVCQNCLIEVVVHTTLAFLVVS